MQAVLVKRHVPHKTSLAEDPVLPSGARGSAAFEATVTVGAAILACCVGLPLSRPCTCLAMSSAMGFWLSGSEQCFIVSYLVQFKLYARPS